MCFNFQETDKTKITGYKVVVQSEQTKKFHSVLSGEEYPLDGSIPVWHSQKNAKINYFCEVLPGKPIKDRSEIFLVDGEAYFLWKKEMIGRTSVFIKKRDARALIVAIRLRGQNNPPCENEFFLVIVKVKLTGDLLKAEYTSRRQEIFVGRKLEILEPIYD